MASEDYLCSFFVTEVAKASPVFCPISPDVDDFLVSECCPITKVLEPTPPITSKQLCFEECQFEGCLEIPAYCFQGHTVPTLCTCGKHRMQGMQRHPECQGTSLIGSCLMPMEVSDTSMDIAKAPIEDHACACSTSKSTKK